VKHLALALLAGAALAASNTVSAQDGPSAGDWEFRIGPDYTLSKTVNFKGGSSVTLDSNTGGKIGTAYYMTDEFSLGMDFAWSRPNFSGTIIGASGTANFVENGRAEFRTFNFTAAYHLLEGPIRPFGVIGLGYNWVSTNVASGPPVAGCWWDPWWGYICSGYQPTKGGSGLQYQAGAGVQFNFSEQFAVDADYRETWIQLHNSNGTPAFGSIEVIFIFRLSTG
jgi:opacity protein-like surface antigen